MHHCGYVDENGIYSAAELVMMVRERRRLVIPSDAVAVKTGDVIIGDAAAVVVVLTTESLLVVFKWKSHPDSDYYGHRSQIRW